MRRRLWLVLLGLGLLGGCDDSAAGPDCQEACSGCQGNVCPTGVCGFQVLVDGSCEGQVEQAQVALGQCAEDLLLVPGEATLLCGHLLGHSDALLTVRGADLVWQQRAYCRPDRQGKVQLLTVTCEGQDASGQDGM
jgi:hypothetical protein